MEVQGNIDRFNGFAGEYDSFRPQCPDFVVRILTGYLRRRPALVADIGCGTGLSTLVWSEHADRVVGIEPNPGMRAIGETKASGMGLGNAVFVEGYSHETGLGPESVDIATCSQSFHWMEPGSTLAEVHRILRPGGVFSAYDCDWPPVVDWTVEKGYEGLFGAVKRFVAENPGLRDASTQWDKERHLDNIRKSGLFEYSREIVFHNTEPCDSRRYKGLALSQGGLQSLLKAGCTEIGPYIESFSSVVDSVFGTGTRMITLCYRMRIGIKG